MLTTINPCWEFDDCNGYLVDDFKGKANDKAKVYVSNLMAKIKKSKKTTSERVIINSVNQICINDSSTLPKIPTKLTSVNYVEAYVSDSLIKKKANEDLYEKFKKESPYPTPMYYIPFEVEVKSGTEVYVSAVNSSLISLCVS